MMIVNFKKLSSKAVLPSSALPGDAGLDLTATEINETNSYYEVKFGIAVEIPTGYFALMVPRSSVTKMNMMMKNSVGIIDSGYRGELVCRYKKVKFDDGETGNFYKVGEKAAQLIILPYPNIQPVEVAELSSTERGNNGWGSTSKN